METETKIANPVWHSLGLDDVVKKIKTDLEEGLSSSEASKRLAAAGPNTLPKGQKTTVLEMIWRQFTSPLVYILLLAAVMTWWLSEYTDTTVILLVVGVNALIGLFQEYRASKIFEKLKAIVKIEALVIRGGKTLGLDSENLVPGDLVILKAGNKVPADARIINAVNLETNEALLTGESKPVKKNPGQVKPKAVVGDRTNMVFMGTVIEQGEGRALIVATGGKTEIGQISLLTQSTEEELSPLQLRIKKLGGFITKVFVGIAIAIFLIGITSGHELTEMIKTTIAVAVAAIPEGLPAAISVILAVSSQRILQKKGLIMRLVAAETLGSTSVICTDKTGTLTYGKMKVEKIISKKPDRALLVMGLSNEAVVQEQDGNLEVKGESTDKAKLESFIQANKNWREILKSLPRVAFIPFNADWKYLASFHQEKNKIRVAVSGAPETILSLCKIPAKEKQAEERFYEDLAGQGFRIIAAAEKSLNSPRLSSFTREGKGEFLRKQIQDLDYLGLAAIRDPIREDVGETLKITREAGIKVIMITGDHILTAQAIGRELGFGLGQDALISGEAMDSISDEQLKARIPKLEIIARATPVHKIRIIDAWQSLGAVVAMTGDGVNDAPALKSANIGVAIGSGTDVAKEASDLVLLNDSFSTVTAAVTEGRTGFANIRKATLVVMSNAFTELTLIASSLVFAVPFPITAVQILWVNLVEDSLPVLALAFEGTEKGIMKKPPLSPDEPILNKEAKFIIFAVSLFTDLLLVGIFLYLVKFSGWELIKIQSFIFTATAIPTLVNVFAFKSLKEPLFKINVLSNHLLVISAAVGFLLMGAALYLPFLNNFLKTVPLSAAAILSIFLFASFKLVLVELTKKWYNRNN